MAAMRWRWRAARFTMWWWTTLYLRARVYGRRHVPSEGGVLLVSNHQCWIDPALVGMGLDRECHYMARDTLFVKPAFARLIRSMNAFPVQRNAADVGAIKEALRRLKQGHAVLVFPEGTRTPDGRVHEMLPGLVAIAKRAQVPIVPVLLDGLFQAWPKWCRLPRAGDMVMQYGKPIWPKDYADMDPDQLMARIRAGILGMQRRWHGRLPERRLKWHGPDEESTCDL